MSDFRPVAHLQEQLGEARWRALINPANTGRVQEFCDTILESGLPTEMTLGGRTYDILSFLRGDEKSVKVDVMVARAKEMGAHQGREEREHLLNYQGDIPIALRGKVVFVFTDDRHPDGPGLVCDVFWRGSQWVRGWDWIDDGWFGCCRVLRRKSAR